MNEELRIIGRNINGTSCTFEGTGELLLPNGEVTETGFGKYLRMPLYKILEADPLAQELKVSKSQKTQISSNSNTWNLFGYLFIKILLKLLKLTI